MLDLAQENMKTKEENIKVKVAEKNKTAPAEEFSSELSEPRWSVISFETREASNLSYVQAEQKLKELEAAKVAGLCIVSDEAAERASKSAG